MAHANATWLFETFEINYVVSVRMQAYGNPKERELYLSSVKAEAQRRRSPKLATNGEPAGESEPRHV